MKDRKEPVESLFFGTKITALRYVGRKKNKEDSLGNIIDVQYRQSREEREQVCVDDKWTQ